jgi:hypothetical protein
MPGTGFDDMIAAMGWLSRRRRGRPGTLRTADSADLDHLAAFAGSRDGVEAFLEPRTTVTDTTVILVASTGEWTRRRIDGAKAANAFAKRHHIPLYDVESVGYPARMRQWNRERKDAD